MERREFITGGLMTGAALAVSAGCAGLKVAAEKEFKFGVCCNAGCAPKVAAAGFDFFEWSVKDALIPNQDGDDWKRQRERLLSQPIPIRSCNGFFFGDFRLTGEKKNFERALDFGEKACRRADEVGVRTIVFGSGGARNAHGDFGGPRRPDPEQGLRDYTDFCRQLVRRVADCKVAIVIEPLRPNETNVINYVWQGLQVCEDISSPRLQQLADLFHMQMGREEPASLIRAGKRLLHCHVASYGTRLFPGSDPDGIRCLKPYFDALRRIGYEGGVSCECAWGKSEDYERNLAIALETLKSL